MTSLFRLQCFDFNQLQIQTKRKKEKSPEIFVFATSMALHGGFRIIPNAQGITLWTPADYIYSLVGYGRHNIATYKKTVTNYVKMKCFLYSVTVTLYRVIRSVLDPRKCEMRQETGLSYSTCQRAAKKYRHASHEARYVVIYACSKSHE